jgi:hypothetical protein
MTNAIVAPIKPFVTEEGIELYATDTECGMSFKGLGRFCGVDSARISEIVSAFGDGEMLKARPAALIALRESETLKPFVGNNPFLETQIVQGFEKNAKVLKSEVVAAICEYYAFEKNNETARFSYRKFAKLGIESWIRKTTGHEQPSAVALSSEQMATMLLQSQEAIIKLQQQVIETQAENAEHIKYLSKATINAPGLENIMEMAQEVDTVVRPFERENWTLAEWMWDTKEIQLEGKMFKRFVSKVHGAYKAIRHEEPKKAYRPQVNNPKKNAHMQVYTDKDFGILQQCYMQTLLDSDK